MLEQKFLALNGKLLQASADKRAHLISYLPDAIRKKLESPDFPEKALPVPMSTEKIGRRVDISHFKHYLDHLPEDEQKYYITAFPKYKQVELTKSGAIYREYESENFSRYVLQSLFKEALQKFPPPGIIPFHPTVELLSDNGVPLHKLISFLGLYDVASEVKKLISRSTLKTLQKAFDKEQIAFINTIGRKNDASFLSPMNLASYKGDEKMLNTLIEERGLYRFVQGIKNAPAGYHFFFTYFLPKAISDKVNILLKEPAHLAITYKGWEDDTITTWRFLCTYSQ